jgi:tetratricopeptide (TPR) repeat protein
LISRNGSHRLVPRLVVPKCYVNRVNELLIGLVGALIATNQPSAVSNLVQQHTGVPLALANPNDPAEQELHKLMVEDQVALDEVDKWIRDNSAFAAQGAGEPREALNRRILARLDLVRKDYEDLLRRYPNFARGHLAYGSFLNDIGEERAARVEYGRAAQLNPKNPAAWNQLGNYCSENGPITNAFLNYSKAIELDPAEPVYYQNLAITIYLFRNDARTYYGLNEAQVFDKALALYRKALQLDPQNFLLATDYAESYYGIRPLRTNDALGAWTNALQAAHDDNEREGVYIHLARIKMAAGRFAEARAHLNDVTNTGFANLRHRLERNLAERENPAAKTLGGGVFTNASAVPAGAANLDP